MSEKQNLKNNAKDKNQIDNPLSKIYKSKRIKQCNCLCCKHCNEYWRPYKKIMNQENLPLKKSIKFKKNFFCKKDCINCLKYIAKKERQWKEYIISSGLEFNEKTYQPIISKAQIDIKEDNKNILIKKIKDLTITDFQKIKVRGDGNCLVRAMLRSIGENELKHLELRQTIADNIESEDLENIGKDLFLEEKCSNKREYIKKIREDGAYLNGIILEVLSKRLKILFGIYLEDNRYSEDPWKIISPTSDDIKGVILLTLLQGNSCQAGHYSGVKLFNNHFLGNINIDSFKVKTELNDIVMFDKTDLNIMILNARSINDYLKKLVTIDLLRSKNIDIALIQEAFYKRR